jgi:hypothetical protein
MVRSPLRGASFVSVDYAFFHHEEHFFGLADILDRVAGYGNDVRELTSV